MLALNVIIIFKIHNVQIVVLEIMLNQIAKIQLYVVLHVNII
jgi:hypothetical protein